jgi:hypothetical protein
MHESFTETYPPGVAKTALKFTFASQTVKISACFNALMFLPVGQGAPTPPAIKDFSCS